jgi:hypothetical protein
LEPDGAAIASVLRRRVEDSTRKNYAQSMKRITKMFEQYRPSALQNGQLSIPLDKPDWEWFLTALATPFDDNTVLSKSSVTGYINALKFMYSERQLVLDDGIKVLLKQFEESFKRIVAGKLNLVCALRDIYIIIILVILDLKKSGVMKHHEGKSHFTMDVYSQLCKCALFASDERSKFSRYVHVFTILCWNMFQRANSIGALTYHNFSWEGDALRIEMAKHKGDPGGEHTSPKHVFANPYEPFMCPILALALHVFSTYTDLAASNHVFSGRPYEGMYLWLQSALTKVKGLGHSVSDYGTHSFRKGATSYCATIPGGPGLISIFNRAEWSLGQVQDRYLCNVDGGDELCGRLICGLKFTDGPKFGTILPRFRPDCLLLTEELWLEILPNYKDYPNQFQRCLPFLLAQICYHYDWLMAEEMKG